MQTNQCFLNFPTLKWPWIFFYSDGAIGGSSPPVQEEAKGQVQENQEPAQDNKQEETVEDNINEVIQVKHRI